MKLKQCSAGTLNSFEYFLEHMIIVFKFACHQRKLKLTSLLLTGVVQNKKGFVHGSSIKSLDLLDEDRGHSSLFNVSLKNTPSDSGVYQKMMEYFMTLHLCKFLNNSGQQEIK